MCLRKGHISRECCMKTRPVCGGKYHAAICNHQIGTTSRESEAPPPVVSSCDQTPQSGLNPEAGSFQPHTSTSLLLGARGMVLLQTTRVQIYVPVRPEQVMDARAILDTGSQQSYAMQRVKDALALKVHSNQLMSIATFGYRHGYVML